MELLLPRAPVVDELACLQVAIVARSIGLQPGADFVAKAPPDGYTILMGSIGTQALNASLYRNMPYDSAKDFTPVALVSLPRSPRS